MLTNESAALISALAMKHSLLWQGPQCMNKNSFKSLGAMFLVKTALSPHLSIPRCFSAWQWSQNLKENKNSAPRRNQVQVALEDIKESQAVILTLAFFVHSWLPPPRHDKFTTKHFFHPSDDRICSRKFCQWLHSTGELHWLGQKKEDLLRW